MNLILNEIDYINKCLKYGYIDIKKPTTTLNVLCKYYLIKGMDETQAKESLDQYMKSHYKNYNPIRWSDALDRIVKKQNQYNHQNLLCVDKIHITESELNTIRSIQNMRLEKISFVLLVYAKIYNQINDNKKNWVNCAYKEIFSDSKIAISPNKQAMMIHKLVELGLVETSRVIDCTNVHVKFVDDDSPVAITISDFRNYVYEYLKYIGEKNIGDCSECGTLIKITNNRKKYCHKCWMDKHKEQDREYQRRKYHSRLLENDENH